MKKLRMTAAAACVAVMLAAAVLSSCSITGPVLIEAPEIPGATFAGNSACADCHGPITRAFPASPHARIHSPASQLRGQSGCESCHGPGSEHIRAGGGRGKFIVNPGSQPSACYTCHREIEAKFAWPQRHPVPDGHMTCAQCHDPHGRDVYVSSRGLATAREIDGCAQCHREQTQPFIFEHEAMREGCVVCHDPHGSPSRKLLTEADQNLCLKCHAQTQGAGVSAGEIYIGKVPHGQLLRRGSCWSAGCHTAVHGSNVDPRMFY